MKQKIQDKIRYYSQQQDKFIGRYLESTKRSDRDAVIRTRVRVEVYKELLELINAEV